MKRQVQRAISILLRWIIFCKVKQAETLATEIGEIDRISQLPECVCHRILAFLNACRAPPAELVRMSVLSKNWFDLTASFPVLDFNILSFRSRESFFKYVEYTTSRLCHQNVTAHRLTLIANILEPEELDIVGRCLNLVLKKGLKVLLIDIFNSDVLQSNMASAMRKYRLPNILLSVSELESLTIHNCELPSSLMVDAFKFKCLIYLQLIKVHVDDEIIKSLTTSCPLLQVFYIRSCLGFKIFCIHGHQNLQKVWIEYITRVERIDIEAPNLVNFLVMDTHARGAPWMNMASCKKLRTVIYIGHPLPNSNGFTNFLSNFPFIEYFVLVTKYKCNLKLSSHSLKTLVLHSNCDFEDIDLNTPNLVSFISRGPFNAMENRWPLLRGVFHRKACIQCYPGSHIDTLWFQKLRQFLDKKNGFKVLNLYIQAVYSQKFTELVKLKAVELPPYELEHVELQLETHEESLAHIAFVDAFLWCCRPRYLTLRSSFPITDFEDQSDVVKFTCERLLRQEDQRHTYVDIISRLSSSSLMSMLGEGNAICFVKKVRYPNSPSRRSRLSNYQLGRRHESYP